MPYRSSPTQQEPVERVDLLRFEPAPWYRHRSAWGLGFTLLFFARAARGGAADLPSALWALGIFACVTLAGLWVLWREAARLVLSLERDSRGRRVVIERAWGALVRRRVVATEEPLSLTIERGDATMRLLSKRTPSLVATLHTGAGSPLEVAALFHDDDAERFANAAQGFDERAASVATAAQLRERAIEAERRADEGQRAIDERYRAWFDEAVAADDVESLRQVLDRGFSIARPLDRFGSTALDLAASRGAARCVQLLIDRGAPATSNALAMSAHGAPAHEQDPACVRYVETVRVLVDAGADPEGRDREGGEVRASLDRAAPAMREAARKR